MSLISVDKTITIALSVKDRHASATWYQEMLGFELLYHADEAGWSEVQTNTAGVVIGLGEPYQARAGQLCPGVWYRGSGRRAAEAGTGRKSSLTATPTLSKAWSKPQRSTIQTATR